jgi:hypothetical protein
MSDLSRRMERFRRMIAYKDAQIAALEAKDTEHTEAISDVKVTSEDHTVGSHNLDDFKNSIDASIQDIIDTKADVSAAQAAADSAQITADSASVTSTNALNAANSAVVTADAAEGKADAAAASATTANSLAGSNETKITSLESGSIPANNLLINSVESALTTVHGAVLARSAATNIVLIGYDYMTGDIVSGLEGDEKNIAFIQPVTPAANSLFLYDVAEGELKAVPPISAYITLSAYPHVKYRLEHSTVTPGIWNADTDYAFLDMIYTEAGDTDVSFPANAVNVMQANMAQFTYAAGELTYIGAQSIFIDISYNISVDISAGAQRDFNIAVQRDGGGGYVTVDRTASVVTLQPSDEFNQLTNRSFLSLDPGNKLRLIMRSIASSTNDIFISNLSLAISFHSLQ